MSNSEIDIISRSIQTGAINSQNISFDLIKRTAGKNLEIWNQLGRGRSILTSTQQLDQYLYSYGPMTQKQWAKLLEKFPSISSPIQIFDYGCGQGLALSFIFDKFKKQTTQFKKVVLIEPSSIALARAKSIVTCYCPEIEIETINKKIQDLEAEEIASDINLTNFHVFSNVLDIDGFDHFDLFSKILETRGRHTFIAVSHDRDHNGGSSRFHELNETFEELAKQKKIKINSSYISNFVCEASKPEESGKPAISWVLEMEF